MCQNAVSCGDDCDSRDTVLNLRHEIKARDRVPVLHVAEIAKEYRG